MSQVTLSASTNRPLGSRHSRRLRRAGSIPGVVYGSGVEALPVAIDAKAFRTAVAGEQGLNTVIHLDADGTTYVVMARVVQRHPVRGTVSHVDFQVVDVNQPVLVEVPLHLVGDAVEIRHSDWEIDQHLFTLEVMARPTQIPTAIEIDISALTAGDAIRVSDLSLPAGVEPAGDESLAIVSTRASRVAEEPVSEEEGAEPAAEAATDNVADAG